MSRRRWLFAVATAAVLAHLGDVVTTLAAPGLEANPLVGALGVGAWALAKTGLLTAFVVGVAIAADPGAGRRVRQGARVAVLACLAVGVFAVVGNALTLALVWGVGA